MEIIKTVKLKDGYRLELVKDENPCDPKETEDVFWGGVEVSIFASANLPYMTDKYDTIYVKDYGKDIFNSKTFFDELRRENFRRGFSTCSDEHVGRLMLLDLLKVDLNRYCEHWEDDERDVYGDLIISPYRLSNEIDNVQLDFFYLPLYFDDSDPNNKFFYYDENGNTENMVGVCSVDKTFIGKKDEFLRKVEQCLAYIIDYINGRVYEYRLLKDDECLYSEGSIYGMSDCKVQCMVKHCNVELGLNLAIEG